MQSQSPRHQSAGADAVQAHLQKEQGLQPLVQHHLIQMVELHWNQHELGRQTLHYAPGTR